MAIFEVEGPRVSRLPTISPLHRAEPLHLIVDPLTRVPLHLMQPLSFSISEAVFETANKNRITGTPLLSTLSMLPVKPPLSFMRRTQRIHILSIPMGHRMVKTPLISIAQTIPKNAMAMGIPEYPVSLVKSLIFPLHLALALAETPVKATLVYSHVFVLMYANGKAGAESILWQLRCLLFGQCLIHLFPRKIARIHLILVSLINRLLDVLESPVLAP